MVRGGPSSRTSKSAAVRSGTGRPWLSVTATSTRTTSTRLVAPGAATSWDRRNAGTSTSWVQSRAGESTRPTPRHREPVSPTASHGERMGIPGEAYHLRSEPGRFREGHGSAQPRQPAIERTSVGARSAYDANKQGDTNAEHHTRSTARADRVDPPAPGRRARGAGPRPDRSPRGAARKEFG